MTVPFPVAVPVARRADLATLRDHAAVTVWFATTFNQFPGDELILYPLALYFAYAFVRDWDALFDRLMRSLVLFAFPVWWLLSLSWGLAPGGIVRSGAQMILTVLICYCAVVRLDARRIVLSLLFAAAIWSVLGLLEEAGGGLQARGAFSSKNANGVAAVILLMAATCTVLDRGSGRLVRLAAAALVPLALRQIVVSSSATAVILAAAVAGIVAAVLLLRSGAFVRPAPLAALCLLGATLCAIAAPILAVQEFDPIQAGLGLFGKDTTLTGRTVLWEYAEAEIAQRPLLGVGHGGFWTPEDGLSTAARIHEEFHKSTYSRFSFHNSYYEIAVHQGLIGVAVALLPVLWCLWRIFRGAVGDLSMPSAFFVCVALITLVRSVTESGLMAPFAMLPMLFYIGALLTLPRPEGRAA